MEQLTRLGIVILAILLISIIPYYIGNIFFSFFRIVNIPEINVDIFFDWLGGMSLICIFPHLIKIIFNYIKTGKL